MDIEDLDMNNYSELESNHIKSSNRYRSQILSMCSNSDIAEMVSDKFSEKRWIELEKAKYIKWLRWDNRKISILLWDDEIKEVEKIMNWLNYILKDRNPNAESWDMMEKLEKAKREVWIVTLIEYMSWTKVQFRRNNKCFLPDHKDKTGSCKVYENTNSRFCFWCHRGGDWVSFIEHYFSCSKADAIKKFISFN